MLIVLLLLLVFGGGQAFSAGTLPRTTVTSRSEQRVLNQMVLRQALHFRQDYDYIARLQYASDAVHIEAMDAVFTPEEAKELEDRLELEDDGQTVQDFFAARPDLQDAFGGLYLEHSTGGKLILLLVGDRAQAKEIRAALPRLKHEDRLQIKDVKWTKTKLKQQYITISQVLEQHPTIMALTLDEVQNQVMVTIDPSLTGATPASVVDKRTLPADLAQLVADPAVTVWAETVFVQGAAVKAGEGFATVNGGANGCTLAFEVVYNNEPSMVTAGHCVSSLASGAKIYQGTTQIGTYQGKFMYGSASNTGYGVDAGIIRMSSAATATDDIYQGASPSLDVTGAVATNSYTVGNLRCFRGIKSGTICGTITRSAFDFQYQNRWFRDMFTLDPTPQGGDSGGPVYRKATYTDTADAAGVLMGWYGDDSSHSKWGQVAGWFSLTLVTTD